MSVIARTITNRSGIKTFASNISIPNNCTITNNGTVTLTGSISGAGGLVHRGSGTTILDNANSYTGFTNVQSGTLKIGNSGNLGNGTYNGTLVIGGIFDYSGSVDQIITGTVTGGSRFVINGPGRFHIRSPFGEFGLTGTIEINNGFLRVGNNDTIPAGNGNGIGTGSISGVNRFIVNSGGTLELNRANSATGANINGVITGTGSINVLGGNYAVAGGGDYSGLISITDSGAIWNMSKWMPNASFVNNGNLTLSVGSTWNTNYIWNVTISGNTTNTIYETDYLIGTSIGAANVTAQIQSAGFGNDASEFVGFVPGRIALVQRGVQSFQTKVNNAIAAGAAAVIIYNNTTGLVTPSVTTNIPVIMITQSLGQQLVTTLSTETVTSRIDTSSSSVPFSNSVTGNGTIVKAGVSPLTVSLGAGFTGIVSITGGVLRSDSNFGGASSVRPSTGAFEILGGLTISTPFSLSGTGISSGGAIRNISDNNTLSGAINLLAASRINSDSGLLVLGGTTSGAFGLTVGGAGNTRFDGPITTVTTLTKDGAGTLELTAANTYTSTTTISGGTLKLTGVGTVGAGAVTNNSALVIENNDLTTFARGISGTGTLTKNLNTKVIFTGTLSHTGATTINAGTLALGSGSTTGDTSGSTGGFVVNSGATLEINRSNASTFARPVSGAGAIVVLGGGTATFTGALTHTGGTTVGGGTMSIGSGSTTGSITGDIVNNATVQFNRSDALSYAGVISGTGNLTKAAAGTLTLTGNNTYSGTTTISAGVLRLGHANALGSGTSTVSIPASTAVELTGGISFGRNLSSAGTGVSSGGSLRNITGDNTFSGNFTQTAASRINSDAGTLTLSSAGTLTGTFGLTLGGAGNINVQRTIATSTGTVTKDGTGIAVLSASNTYTGVTTISGGRLQFALASSLYNGTTSSWTRTNIIVNTGATFAINVGGTNEFTTTNVGTLLTNLLTSINNNGLRSGSSIGFDTTNSASDFTISNNITNSAGTGAGAVGVVKLGTGTLVLSGTSNTYTGGTTINGGTLRAGNATCFGTGTITLNAGATLDRAGFTITNTIVNNGGTIIN